MAKRSVLFIDGIPLYIENIRRTDDSLSAHVINGSYNLQLKFKTLFRPDNILLAKDGRSIVTKRVFETFKEIEIPDDTTFKRSFSDSYGAEYSEAINWAEKQIEKAGIEEAIRQGLEDVDAGRVRPAKEVFDDLRKKHRIPSGICHCGLSMDEQDHGSPYHTPADNPIIKKEEKENG